MRIRTLKPEFWSHPVMNRQSSETQLLAIGLLNMADDEGYFYADPKMVRNTIRQRDDDSRITTVSLQDLEKIGFIQTVTHPTHGEIGRVVNFSDHQVINKPKPSKIKHLYESGSDTVEIPDAERLEGKGKERNRERNICPQADDLTPLWNEFLPNSKRRSSKKLLADEWKRIPAKDRPTIATVIESLRRWKLSEDWVKDDGQFAQGAHLWIKQRKWEVDPLEGTRAAGKPVTIAEPDGWLKALLAKYPTFDSSLRWDQLTPAIRQEVRRLLDDQK